MIEILSRMVKHGSVASISRGCRQALEGLSSLFRHQKATSFASLARESTPQLPRSSRLAWPHLIGDCEWLPTFGTVINDKRTIQAQVARNKLVSSYNFTQDNDDLNVYPYAQASRVYTAERAGYPS